jgi:hypothetical protein
MIFGLIAQLIGEDFHKSSKKGKQRETERMID